MEISEDSTSGENSGITKNRTSLPPILMKRLEENWSTLKEQQVFLPSSGLWDIVARLKTASKNLHQVSQKHEFQKVYLAQKITSPTMRDIVVEASCFMLFSAGTGILVQVEEMINPFGTKPSGLCLKPPTTTQSIPPNQLMNGFTRRRLEFRNWPARAQTGIQLEIFGMT